MVFVILSVLQLQSLSTLCISGYHVSLCVLVSKQPIMYQVVCYHSLTHSCLCDIALSALCTVLTKLAPSGIRLCCCCHAVHCIEKSLTLENNTVMNIMGLCSTYCDNGKKAGNKPGATAVTGSFMQ